MSRDMVQRKAREWIFSEGLAKPGDSHATVMRRLAEWRTNLPKLPKPGDKDWARKVIARYEAGERMSLMVLRMAKEALGVQDVPLLRQPIPAPVRPDARERQAGDVEPAF